MSVIVILVVICSVLISLSLVLLCYISISKVKSNQLDTLNKQILNTYKDDMFDYLVNGNFSQAIVPRQSLIPAFEKMLLEFNYIIAGNDVKKHTKHYAEQYFTEYYKQMLLSRKWSKKVNALTGIFGFKMETLTEEVLRLFHQKKIREDKMLSYLIIKILISSKNQKIIELMEQYNIKLASFQYRELFQIFTNTQWQDAISMFNQLNFEFKLSLFDAIALFNKVEYQEFLETEITVNLYQQKLEQQIEISKLKLLAEKALNDFSDREQGDTKQLEQALGKLNQTNELIIRGLKTISTIGYTTNIDAFNIYLSTEVWQEKLMIIRLYGKMRLAEKQRFLEESLSDDHYLVRKETAHSLSLLLMTKEQLNDIYDRLDDQYAKDILSEYI